MSPTDDELLDIINEVDADGNGDIDLPEFINLMNRRGKQTDHEEELAEAFKLFDREGNGLIKPKQLKEVMTILGEEPTDEEVEVIMKIIDADGNDVIGFTEFVACFNKLVEER